jgi:hypothetical protein
LNDREVNSDLVRLSLSSDRRGDRPPGVALAAAWREVAGHVERGGRAVLVATEPDALPLGLGLRLEQWGDVDDPLEPSVYASGWIRSTGLGWLHPRVTDGLALGPRVDMAFAGLCPEEVILGYEPRDAADVLAGHYLGWIHRVTATIGMFRHGRGAGIVCTFPLLSRDGADPVATALLDRLARIAASPAFRPRKELTFRSAAEA